MMNRPDPDVKPVNPGLEGQATSGSHTDTHRAWPRQRGLHDDLARPAAEVKIDLLVVDFQAGYVEMLDIVRQLRPVDQDLASAGVQLHAQGRLQHQEHGTR